MTARFAAFLGIERLRPFGPVPNAAWVTDVPNFLTGRTLPLRFRFHVAMAGVLAIGGNLPASTSGDPRWSSDE